MEFSNYKVKLPRNCPDCGEPLEEFFQNNRKLLGCSEFPNCRFTLDVLDYSEKLSIEEKDGKTKYPSECPLCASKLAIYIGKFGPFFGCNGYPECRFSLNFDDLENILCPQCGNSMTERTGKYGLFLGCRSFPNCRFTYNIRVSKNKGTIEKKQIKKEKMRKKLTMDKLDDMETPDYNKILEVLTENWQSIKEICQKLDIEDKYDVRFVQLRLKHFESEGLIQIIKKDSERYYKLLKF